MNLSEVTVLNAKGMISFTENVVKDDCLQINLFDGDKTGRFNYKGKVEKVYHDRVILRVLEGNEVKEVTISYNDIIDYRKLEN